MAIYHGEPIAVGGESPHAPSGSYTEGDPEQAEKITLTEFIHSSARDCVRVDGGFRGCEVTGDSVAQVVSAVRAAAAIDQNRTTSAITLAGLMSKFPGVNAKVKPESQEAV